MLLNHAFWALIGAVAALEKPILSPLSSQVISHDDPPFTYNRTHFLLHGEPFTFIGGQMDPQRIPYQFWRDRLSKARAMGLNTIFTYTFWNELEPTQGTWLSDEPQNDIAEFFRIAQEEGLWVVLRPGPYICGERDWGGFPSWLAEIPGMVVRTNNTQFMEETKKYMVNLAEKSGLADLQVTRGGPILMVQIENEYGSYGDNHVYTSWVRDIVVDSFEITPYTNDGGDSWPLQGGYVPGVLAAVDGGSWALPARDLYITDPTSLGPLLNGEYYTWTFDIWGSHNPHNTTVGNDGIVNQILGDIPYHFNNFSASISFYMVHGGSSFGFSSGALWQNRHTAFISSYDYGSPIDETGRTTDLYFKMRDTILPFVPNGSVPEPPANLPRASIPEFTLSPYASLFKNRGEKTSSTFPLTMEALGQSYGFTMYEHTATAAFEGDIKPGDRPRDRVIVYVNEKVQGVMDSQYQHPLNVTVSLQPGDKLQLLVENLGRVGYYSRGNPYKNYVVDPWKGVKGNITVGDEIIEGWDMYALQLDTVPSKPSCIKNGTSDSPVFYKGSFVGPSMTHDTPMTLDTFITVPNGVKGNVFVNGFNLGRYWLVGPQQSLYLPGSLVKPDEVNEVVILELEPWQMETTSMVAYGDSERFWGNNPDPDCLECV